MGRPTTPSGSMFQRQSRQPLKTVQSTWLYLLSFTLASRPRPDYRDTKRQGTGYVPGKTPFPRAHPKRGQRQKLHEKAGSQDQSP